MTTTRNARTKKSPRVDENFATRLIPDEEYRPRSVEDVSRLPSFLSKLRACERFLGTKYSEIEHDFQNALVLRRLQQMVNTIYLNPLWAERLKDAGVTTTPRNFEEWQAVPLSDKNVMRDYYMGARPGLVVPLSHGGFEVVASGGTSSGLPVETVYSLRELVDTYVLAGEFMGQYQLSGYLASEDPKWVMTTLADYQMWSSGTMVGGVLQRIPGINYIGAGPVVKDVYHHIMSYPGPKAILGISAGIAILSDFSVGLDESSRRTLRVALYGSGVLPYRKQLELKAAYPNLNILSYFAATQAETIGLQLKSDSATLSAVPGLHLIEIVDGNGRWVAVGEEGELVVTRLHAHEAPLLRLKLGDRMIRRAESVGSGLKTLQFEFAGRSGDIIHLCDTQYSAPQVYKFLCRQLITIGRLDLEQVSHNIQFFNNRRSKTLCLLLSVDNPIELNSTMNYNLGIDGVQRAFLQALIHSLSLFNHGESNVDYLQRSGYLFEIRFVGVASSEIRRTSVGKVPLVRDEA